MKRITNKILQASGIIRVFFANYIGRLLVLVAAVLIGRHIFLFDIYETTLLLLLMGSTLAIVHPALIAFCAIVMFISAPFYHLQGNINAAEHAVVYGYYLLWLLVAHQAGFWLWERSIMIRRMGAVMRSREQSIYYFFRRLGRRAAEITVKFSVAALRRVVHFIWRNKAELALAIVLFFIPFFWFQNGEADFGGDSSRLYFYDPLNWLKSMGLYEINASGFDNPNFFIIPFLLLLQGLKWLFRNNASTMLAVFNGMLLSGAFLSVYGTVRVFLSHREDKRYVRAAAIMGALFFVLSQSIMYGWQKSLYTFHQIAVYPLVVLLWLAYIRSRRFFYILVSLLVTFVFSVNFSLYSAPSFFSFFMFAFPLVSLYAVFVKRKKVWTQGFVLFLVLFLLLHAFQLFPQLVSISNPASNIYENLFTKHGQLDRGLNYFHGVRSMVRLIYNIVGFTQYYLYTQTVSSLPLLKMLFTFGVQVLYLFLIFPIIIVGGFMISLKERVRVMRLVLLTLMSLLLISLFFMTANIFGIWGPKMYAALFSVPGFSMFRSFYGVFAIVSVYILALTFGVASHYVLVFLPHRVMRAIFIGGLLVLLGYNGIPFFQGSIVNVVMSDTKGVKLSNHFRSSLDEMLIHVRNDTLDARIVTLPLTNFGYQIIDGEFGGAYVGPSPLGMLAGRQVFSGLASFDYPPSSVFSQEFILDRLRVKDYRTLNRLFSLLNVGYIFYNSNPDIYLDKFIGWPYSKAVWDAFPLFADFDGFIKRLGYTPIYSADTYILYNNQAYFLPHIYIPLRIKKVDNEGQMKDNLINDSGYELQTVFYVTGTAADSLIAKFSDGLAHPPILEIKKINTTKYRLLISNITANFPLIFSEPFHPGWRLALESVAGASGTDGITASRQIGLLDEKNHTRANQYANGWWIDLNYIRDHYGQALKQNVDGSYTMNATLIFAPQENFYTGAAISLLALIIIVLLTIVLGVVYGIQARGRVAQGK